MIAWTGSVALYALVMTITPGPNNLLLASSGLRFGLRRTLPQLAGIIAGVAVMNAASAAGLGTLFTVLPWLQLVLKIGGSAYLLWLAWRSWRTSSLASADLGTPMGFWRAVAFQFVNPKAWVMTLSVTAGFLHPGPAYLLETAIVLAAFAIVGAPSNLLWAGFGATMRHWLSERRIVVVNRVLAVITALTIILFWI